MAKKRVLSVGQCMADHSAISYTLRMHFDADVVGASSLAEAVAQLGKETFDLILVNRILDRDHASGLDVIEHLKKATATPLMLVSNHEDAQCEAEKRGAVRGFGKAVLGDEEVVQKLKLHLT
jgi:DNA-binding NtrC family response regulator